MSKKPIAHHPKRQPGDQPRETVPDKAEFPLICDGNGIPQTRAYSPACPFRIPVGTPFYIAKWSTSPHQTVHCRACKEHFFSPQRGLDLKGD
jgi:hypothetical protein